MSTWKSTVVFCCIGMFLLFQCIHAVVVEERRGQYLCIAGKLVFSFLFLCICPFPPFCFLGFFSFYPKQKRKEKILPALFLQILSVFLFLAAACFLRKNKISVDEIIILLLFTGIFAASDIILSKLLFRNHQLYQQMEQTAVSELKVKCLNEKLSIQSQTADRNARLEERENIARNIHNVVGHTITAAIVSLQAYEVLKEAKPEAADDKLSATNERMHLALEEIRRVVRVMDSETDDISINDFCSLLQAELYKLSMDTEIKIYHNMEEFSQSQGDGRLLKRTYEFLHSVLAECLNNGIRHGGATEFTVYLKADPMHIQLSVSDNGMNFQKLSFSEQQKKLQNGFGLRKIKEYVEKNAGSLQVETEIGFNVRVTLPRISVQGKSISDPK